MPTALNLPNQEQRNAQTDFRSATLLALHQRGNVGPSEISGLTFSLFDTQAPDRPQDDDFFA